MIFGLSQVVIGSHQSFGERALATSCAPNQHDPKPNIKGLVELYNPANLLRHDLKTTAGDIEVNGILQVGVILGRNGRLWK